MAPPSANIIVPYLAHGSHRCIGASVEACLLVPAGVETKSPLPNMFHVMMSAAVARTTCDLALSCRSAACGTHVHFPFAACACHAGSGLVFGCHCSRRCQHWALPNITAPISGVLPQVCILVSGAVKRAIHLQRHLEGALVTESVSSNGGCDAYFAFSASLAEVLTSTEGIISLHCYPPGQRQGFAKTSWHSQ